MNHGDQTQGPHERRKQNHKNPRRELDSGSLQFDNFKAIVKQQIIKLVTMQQINIRRLAPLARLMRPTHPAAKKSGK
jgi:c-di-GMP-binding flagellar brake protein YcgR